jgi:NADPH-dependent 2,4-dienoyl-CoA reductase/sulfur reductase-like enzyme
LDEKNEILMVERGPFVFCANCGLPYHVNGEVTTEKYDKLVLSPGSAPIRPPLPGIVLPGIFSIKTVLDARHIREWLDRDKARSHRAD